MTARSTPGVDRGPMADDVAQARELATRIDRVLAKLPQSQRAAFELIKNEGLSVAEAAQVLGTTVAAVKLRAHRAYEALRGRAGRRPGNRRRAGAVSATPPPADLRARVLAAANAEPASPRAAGARRRAMALVAGFAAPLAISLYLGWPRSGDRPFAYVASLCDRLAGGGPPGDVGRSLAGTGRCSGARRPCGSSSPRSRRSPCSSRRSWRPLAWPQTLADDARWSHTSSASASPCSARLARWWPSRSFVAASDPVAPRLTGAAIGAASGAWGALAIELHCAHASPAHIVLGHLLPVVVLTLVGMLVGDRRRAPSRCPSASR